MGIHFMVIRVMSLCSSVQVDHGFGGTCCQHTLKTSVCSSVVLGFTYQKQYHNSQQLITWTAHCYSYFRQVHLLKRFINFKINLFCVNADLCTDWCTILSEFGINRKGGWVGNGPCKGHVQFSSQVGNGMVRTQGKRKSSIVFWATVTAMKTSQFISSVVLLYNGWISYAVLSHKNLILLMMPGVSS
jgi:hypothetical protein